MEKAVVSWIREGKDGEGSLDLQIRTSCKIQLQSSFSFLSFEEIHETIFVLSLKTNKINHFFFFSFSISTALAK